MSDFTLEKYFNMKKPFFLSVLMLVSLFSMSFTDPVDECRERAHDHVINVYNDNPLISFSELQTIQDYYFIGCVTLIID